MKNLLRGVAIAIGTFLALCIYWGTFAVGLVFAIVKSYMVLAIIICMIYLPAAAVVLAILDRIEIRAERQKRKKMRNKKCQILTNTN